MAFLEEDEEERRRREEAEGGGGVPVSGTTADTMPGTSGVRSPGAQPNNAFVDVASYLQANKPQAKETASRVAGKLTEEEQGIRSGIQSATDAYKTKVGEGSVTLDDDLIGRAAAAPESFVKNNDDLQKFFKQRDATYTGPGSYDESPEFVSLLERVKSGQEKAKSIDTSEGRKSYLYGIGKNPTAGVVSLDDLLIGGDPDARKMMTDAAQPFETLSGALSDASKNAGDAMTAGKTGTEAARTTVANRFTGEGGAIPTFQAMLDKKVADARTAAVGRQGMDLQRAIGPYAELRKEFDDGAFYDYDPTGGVTSSGLPINTSPAFGRFHKEPGELGYGKIISPDDFATYASPEVAINKENVAGRANYLRESALQQLMGDQYDTLPDDMSKAGTAPESLLDFNSEGYQNRIKGMLGEADTNWLDAWNRGQNNSGPAAGYVPPEYTQQQIDTRDLAQINKWRSSSDPRVQQYAKDAVDVLRRKGFNVPDLTPATPPPPTGPGTGPLMPRIQPPDPNNPANNPANWVLADKLGEFEQSLRQRATNMGQTVNEDELAAKIQQYRESLLNMGVPA